MKALSALFKIIYMWSNILDGILFYIIIFYDIYSLGVAEWVILTDDEDAYEDRVDGMVRFIFPKIVAIILSILFWITFINILIL